ncbi:MAG: transcriptional repressor LexA [Candidatus Sumerlaeaceae bacterium]
MHELTPKQRAVVAFLAKTERQGTAAPTYREIGAALRVDVRAAYQHIQALEKKGVIHRTGGHRGIELAPEYAPPRGVPLIGRVAAGLPVLAEQNIDDYVDLRTITADEDSFLLKVRGDSMIDKSIFDGDFVLVQPRHRLTSGEIGVVAIGGEATVKEVHQTSDGVVLVSYNAAQRYPDQVYRWRDDIRIVGKVIMTFRFVR